MFEDTTKLCALCSHYDRLWDVQATHWYPAPDGRRIYVCIGHLHSQARHGQVGASGQIAAHAA